MTYKAHDPARQATSPWYLEGREDGLEDAISASQCPAGYPMYWQEDKAHSSMYRAGYEAGFQPSPCPCDGSCSIGRQFGEAPGGTLREDLQ